MKSKIILIALLASAGIFLNLVQGNVTPTLKEGDILFQTSGSSQSKAIQLATGSQYSHCGVVVKVKDRLMIAEAVQPVKYTTVDAWIKRGINSKYVVKRISGADTLFQGKRLSTFRNKVQSFTGKNYDLYFDWSDDKIYCSELVWKVYQKSFGIQLCPLHQLNEYHLDHPAVKKKLSERYGSKIPWTSKMVSPADILNSKLLTTVSE